MKSNTQNGIFETAELFRNTSASECEGYEPIRHMVISNEKASMLSKISEQTTKEPFVVEVAEKGKENGHTVVKFKVHTFESKEEAERFQESLVV